MHVGDANIPFLPPVQRARNGLQRQVHVDGADPHAQDIDAPDTGSLVV